MRPAFALSVLMPIVAATLQTACAAASGPAPAPAPPATTPAPVPAPPVAPPAVPAQPPRASYVCDRGTRFEVTFEPDAARMTLAPSGEQLTLPQQLSGSGYRYATPRHELRGKGDDATWTVGRSAPETCKATRLAP